MRQFIRQLTNTTVRNLFAIRLERLDQKLVAQYEQDGWKIDCKETHSLTATLGEVHF